MKRLRNNEAINQRLARGNCASIVKLLSWQPEIHVRMIVLFVLSQFHRAASWLQMALFGLFLPGYQFLHPLHGDTFDSRTDVRLDGLQILATRHTYQSMQNTVRTRRASLLSETRRSIRFNWDKSETFICLTSKEDGSRTSKEQHCVSLCLYETPKECYAFHFGWIVIGARAIFLAANGNCTRFAR